MIAGATVGRRVGVEACGVSGRVHCVAATYRRSPRKLLVVVKASVTPMGGVSAGDFFAGLFANVAGEDEGVVIVESVFALEVRALREHFEEDGDDARVPL